MSYPTNEPDGTHRHKNTCKHVFLCPFAPWLIYIVLCIQNSFYIISCQDKKSSITIRKRAPPGAHREKGEPLLPLFLTSHDAFGFFRATALPKSENIRNPLIFLRKMATFSCLAGQGVMIFHASMKIMTF